MGRSIARGVAVNSGNPTVCRMDHALMIEALECRVLMSTATDLKHGPLAKIGDTLATAYLQYKTQISHGAPLVAAAASAAASVMTTGAPGLIAPTSSAAGMIQIEAFAKKNGTSLARSIKSLKALRIHTYGKAVSATIPISQLGRLAGIADLQFARPIWMVTAAGAVTSQTDGADRASNARTAYSGLNGSGVTVGIVSDSFNTAPVSDKYSNDVASGDLPAGVNILSDFSGTGATDEGRAMAQIVYDSAPGASLAFATAQGGENAMASNIKSLRDAGAKVIVDDVMYLSEPMFQDGVVAQAVDNVTASGVAYFSSVGNTARSSYESAWRTGIVRTDGSIPSAAGAPHFYGGTTFNFNPSGSNDLNSFTLGANQSILMSFQWDSPYFSADGTVGSNNDMDAYVLNAAGTQIVGGAATANIGGDPTEIFQFTNTTGASNTFNLMLAWNTASGGPQPGRVKYVEFNRTAAAWAFTTNSGAAFGHTNAAGAESVAAARYDTTAFFTGNSATVPQVESFSAAGGTPILFSATGSRLAQSIIRQTPDITAADGGNTTFFGQAYSDGDSFPNFFGTSCSAPAAAAVAALLLQKNPTLSPAQVDNALQNTAIDMDDPTTAGFDTGYDSRTGFGFIRADAAIASVIGNVSGTVYSDNNANGINNAEPGIIGVTVYVDANNNGQLDAGETSAVTDASGNYSFTNLPSGTNVIRAIPPTGFVATTGAQSVNLTGGGSVSAVNFGLFPVVYTGTSGNDSYMLQVDLGVPANIDVLIAGVLTYTAPKSLVSTLTFNLGGGDDLLTVSYANGNPIPSVGVNYDGGANATSAGDSLVVTGSGNADTITLNNLFVIPGNGSIAVTNIESIAVNSNAGNDALTLGQALGVPVTYDGGTGTNSLTVLGSTDTDAISVGIGQVTVGGVVSSYVNVQTLAVQALNSNDTINVSMGAGAPALTVDAGSEDDSINLNAGASSSAVTVLGGTGNDTLTIASGYASPVNYDGGSQTNSLVYNATTGNDTLAMASNTISGADVVTYANISNLTVNALDGNDTITINSAPASTITTTINGGPGNDTLTVNTALANSGASTFFNGGTTITDQDTLTVNTGTFQLAGDPQTATANLTVNDNSAVVFAAASAGAGINARHLAALNIGASATATINTPTGHGDRAVLMPSALAITAGGKLDLGGNDMIIKNGNVAAIATWVGTGANNGAWNGPGITSGAAHNDATFRTALGVILNNDGSNHLIYGSGTTYGLFDNQNPAITDVLIKYTYYGDADLTGHVDGTDYAKIDNGFNNGLSGWFNGDFNYDAKIDGSDYSLIDNAFNTQGTAL